MRSSWLQNWFRLGICVVALLIVAAESFAADVVTLAGNGKSGYSGDGGPAMQAQVGGPFGLAVGPDGALYVCEIANHVVRRIDEKSGTISTVVGTGTKGYSGNDGPAAKAELNEPYEILFNPAGDMFFVEMKNNIVRRVKHETKIITLVAGNGKSGFAGDEGPGVEAEMKSPHSIALDDGGNLFICDIGNHRVRRMELREQVMQTYAGTGAQKPTVDGAKVFDNPLNGPRALAYDGKSSLYLALREGNTIYRIDLLKKTVHHLAGTGKKGYSGDGGDAKQATFSGPKGIAVGPNGDVYVADTENHAIRVIHIADGTIDTVVGNGVRGDGPDGPPRQCKLAQPHGICVDKSGNIYIGDSSNHRVRKLPIN